MRQAGRLMYGSHRSYSRNCGLGSKETNLLVSLVRRAGVQRGLYGAKITGGGSGGTVAVLVEANPDGTASEPAARALEHVRQSYVVATGREVKTIAGSSPGAMAIPPLSVTW